MVEPITALRLDLERYLALYPAERSRVDRFRRLLDEGSRAFSRERREGHLTASAWVLDPPRRRVLLVHHRKLGKWLQPGGHADGDPDLLRVARREVLEETSVETTAPEGPRLFDLDVHPIPLHGETPAHEHFDVRFLLVATASTEPVGNDETHEARWVPLEDLEGFTGEESMLRMRDKAQELLAVN